MNGRAKRYSSLGLLILILILLAALPFYATAYHVIFLTNVFMYVIVTLAWVIFSGPTGYISLAPAAFFGMGVYASAILSDSYDEDQKDFIKIINEVNARRQAGQLQTQEASEAEEEAAAVSEAPASSGVRQAEVISVPTNEVAQKNAQIQI